jgi:DNA-binding FadR family transcriptional regulator
MSVSRPREASVAAGVSHALLLSDVTVGDVWRALTILEPPIARTAAHARSAADLDALATAIEGFGAGHADAQVAVQRTAEVFRCIGRASHNPVLALAQEPLLQLLEPSLRMIIDKLPQARSRIATAHARLHAALEGADEAEAGRWMERHIRDLSRGFGLAGIDLGVTITA